MHMDYVAIDFETANSRGDSVCSIGLSRFSDGKEVDRYYALINPRQYFNTREYSNPRHHRGHGRS